MEIGLQGPARFHAQSFAPVILKLPLRHVDSDLVFPGAEIEKPITLRGVFRRGRERRGCESWRSERACLARRSVGAHRLDDDIRDRRSVKSRDLARNTHRVGEGEVDFSALAARTRHAECRTYLDPPRWSGCRTFPALVPVEPRE